MNEAEERRSLAATHVNDLLV